jgi:AbrB family looped-hinge helix DNA binding protein
MVTIKQSVDVRIIQGFDEGKTLGVTLPKYWMNEYGIKKGDRVKLTKEEDHIVLEKLEL